MAIKPTRSIFPIEHGKLTTPLDANNLQIINLDESNLSGGGGGGSGASHTVTFVGSCSGDVITADQAVFLDGDIGATISGGALSANAFIVLITSSTVVQVSESLSPDSGITFTFDRLLGNDTGTTTAILKGDGAHGFANAIPDTDYASTTSVAAKEPLLPTTTTDHYLLARRSVTNGSAWEFIDPTSVGSTGNDTGTTTAILKGDGAHGFADAVAGTDYATVASVNAKEPLIATTTNDHYLLARRNVASGSAYEYVNPTTVGLTTGTTGAILKGNTTGGFADAVGGTDYATVGSVAAKEPLLPTTSNDGYVLVRDVSGTWRFVDPVTLGSTSATYGDGATHSNTTFNSTNAVFTTNDTGKTIVCAGNIPSSTLITFVNATTVTLSNAATTTASGLTFTILNRYLVAPSGGTVLSVGVSNPDPPTGANDLLQVGVTNATTSPIITFAKQTAALNTFYGNGTGGAALPAFMSAATARTALGGTTIGQAIFQLTNPSAVGYIRTTTTPTLNGAEFRLPAQVLTDIGAEKVLTFTSPLNRVGVNLDNIVIPQAQSGATNTSGYLSFTDHALFSGKLAGNATLTTTAPLTIGGAASASLSANPTIAMPVASGDSVIVPNVPLVSGYLSGADHSLFVNKPPNTRTIATAPPLTGGGDLSGNRTIGIPKATATVDGYLDHADFAAFTGGSAHTDSTILTSGTVPVLSPIPPLPPITRFVFRGTVANGSTLTVTLPNPNLYLPANGYPYLEFVDLANPAAMSAGGGISLAPPGTTTLDGVNGPLVLPRGLSYIRLNSDGTRWTSTKYFVDSFQDPLAPTNKVLVSVAGTSTPATRTLTLPLASSVTVVPNTGDVAAGTFIYDYDASGNALRTSPGTGLPSIASASVGQVLTVLPGATSVGWQGGVSDFTYVPLTDAATINWPCVANNRTQNAYVTINGARALNITGAASGMHFSLFVIQGTASSTLALPVGSLTPTNGLGIITPPLSTALGSCDLIEGEFVGTTRIPYAWKLAASNLTGALPPDCNVAGALGSTSGTQQVNVATTYVSTNFVATKSAICQVKFNLLQVGAPNYGIQAAIYTDAVRTLGRTTVASMASGSPVISTTAVSGAPNWAAADIGMRITGNLGADLPGFTAGVKYYVGFPAIDSTHINVSNSPTGLPLVNATSSPTGQTVEVYGVPGADVTAGTAGSWSTNSVGSNQVPIYLNAAAATAAGHTGDPNADQNPTVFTGITATGLTVTSTYHVVIRFNGSPTVTDKVLALYDGTGTQINGLNMKSSSNGLAWTNQVSGRKARFATFGVV